MSSEAIIMSLPQLSPTKFFIGCTPHEICMPAAATLHVLFLRSPAIQVVKKMQGGVGEHSTCRMSLHKVSMRESSSALLGDLNIYFV